MDGHYWNYTTCIKSHNLDAIAEAITDILEQEQGCQHLLELPQLEIGLEQWCRLPVWERPRLWVASLCQVNDGWTIVKSNPAEILCPRNTGASCPRLSTLVKKINCDAFHYRVVRDICGILLEVNAQGRYFLSGWNDYEDAYDDDTERFYDEKIDDAGSFPRFSLLDVSESIQAAMQAGEDPEVERKKAEYLQLISQDNPDVDAHFEALLALEPEALQGGAEIVDFALAKILDPLKSCWDLNNLQYSAYAESQQLKERGIKLLYFEPPMTYDPMPFIRLEDGTKIRLDRTQYYKQ